MSDLSWGCCAVTERLSFSCDYLLVLAESVVLILQCDGVGDIMIELTYGGRGADGAFSGICCCLLSSIHD